MQGSSEALANGAEQQRPAQESVAGRGGIAFRHVFPPRHDVAPTTFFGGAPRVPLGFVWPRRPYQWVQGGPSERPLTFLGQVDCAALPEADGRDLLPRDGALLFFVHWDLFEGEDGDHVVEGLVQYAPGCPDEWREAVPPADLPPCYAGQAEFQYEWLKHTDLTTRGYPTTFPKWAVEPRPLGDVSGEFSTELEAERPIIHPEGLSREQLRVLEAAYGEAVGENRLLNDYDRRHDNGVWRPFGAFPHAWIAVEIAAGLLLDPGRSYPETRVEAARWVERARRGGLYESVPDSDRAEFWAWLDGLDAASAGRPGHRRSAYYLNKCLREAAVLSVDFCLAHSAAAAALVPSEARDAVRQRHAALVRGDPRTAGRHQMLGAGLDVQGAPEQHEGTHLLLMQFDTDYGLGWMFGDCGVLQYWITPEDLAARRFDRAHVTLEGH